MASATAETRSGGPSALTVVPSWIVSLLLHTLLLFVLASRFWQTEPVDMHQGDAAGFRDVGIVVKPSETRSDVESPNESDAVNPAREAVAAEESQPPSLTDFMPNQLQLPKRDALPIVGPGGAMAPPGTERDVAAFVQPGDGLPGAPGLGQGATSFYGINDKGTEVVYVLDCSASMEGSPLADAKLHLMQSLQQLKPTQRFGIVFYNDNVFPMVLTGSPDKGLYWATDANKTMARDFIHGRPAGGGTDHEPALKYALKLNPSVIYFLTDAQDGLTAARRDAVRRLNKASRIHCIEFGEGAELRRAGSFLKDLARENEGTYTYVDVTRFRAE